MSRPALRTRFLAVAIAVGALAGCGGTAGQSARDGSPRPLGATPVALEFLMAYENVPGAPYFPLDGLAGCC